MEKASCKHVQGYGDIMRGHSTQRLEINKFTEKIIGCAIEVHKELGPGLLESTYE